MAHLSRFIASLPILQRHESIGELIAERIIASGCITTLLDCFPQTNQPALLPHNPGRRSLSHLELRDFISKFALPSRNAKKILGPNDIVMVVLPAGPESAVAVLALMCYHSAVLIPFTSTSSDLRHYVQHLGAKAIITVPGEETRLQTQELSSDLDLDVIYLLPQVDGTVGIFDTVLTSRTESLAQKCTMQTSKLQSLQDRSLMLLSSRTDGSTGTVCYSAESLIVSTCTVIKAWNLREADIAGECLACRMYSLLTFKLVSQTPLSESVGIICSLLSAILSGGSIIVHSSFDPSVFWTSVVYHRVTWCVIETSTYLNILTNIPLGTVLPPLCSRKFCEQSH